MPESPGQSATPPLLPEPPPTAPLEVVIERVPPDAAEAPRRGVRGVFRRVARAAAQAGKDLVSVAVGRLLEPPASPPGETTAAGAAPSEPARRQRVGVLHRVAEQLRGAADQYIAAKLDEIEARVDAKLDHIEGRIDQKILDLHRQLAQMRDQELRHRLRILKITLIFTVLVAVLSLLYKLAAKYWL